MVLNKGKINRIFIRESNWIGDAVMTTPAISSIKKSLPHAKLFVAANPYVAEVLRYNPCIDEFLVFDSKNSNNNFLSRFRLFREWGKKYNFDIGILFTNSFKSALEVFLMGIPERAGFDTDGRSFLLTRKIHATAEIIKKHEVEYFLDLIKGIGIEPQDKELTLKLSENDEAFAKDFFAKNNLSPARMIVTICAGASVQPKQWHPERYAKVCDLLIRNYGAQIIILGSKADQIVSSKIISSMEKKAINLAGKTSLRESMAIIKNSDLYIGNNSGAMHIASAFKTPIVAILGPSVPDKTAPYLEKEKYELVIKPFECRPCRHNFFKECEPSANNKPLCIEAIEAEDVMEKINLLVRRLGIK